MPIKFNLQSVKIVSSVSHETYLSFGDDRLRADAAPGAVAVLNVYEEFQLIAAIQYTGSKAPCPAVVTAVLPDHYRTRESSHIQHPTLVPGDETQVIWNVVAPSTPDKHPYEIVIWVEAAGPKGSVAPGYSIVPGDSIEGRVEGRIRAITGPSQLVFTTLPFTGATAAVVGEPSPMITVQTQNAEGTPQSPAPAAPTTVTLSSSTSGEFYSDAACTQPIGNSAVTLSAPANSASFYYQDPNAGAPVLTATDTSAIPLLSKATQTETINPAGTTTSVKASPASSMVGQQITLTATVTVDSGSLPPTGTVQFNVDGSAYGQPQALASASIQVALSQGSHEITATYSGDDNYTGSSSNPITVVVSAATVTITGRILTAVGQKPIPDVKVTAQDLTSPGIRIAPSKTGSDGIYSFTATAGDSLQILFPGQCLSPSGNNQQLYLKSSAGIIVNQASATTELPDTYYELRACQVSGTVVQVVDGSPQPFSGVPVTLVDTVRPATVYQTTTDAQGGFCFNPPVGTSFELQVPATMPAGRGTLLLSPNAANLPPTQTGIIVTPDVPNSVPTFTYAPQLSTVIGQVTDGEYGLYGIPVELSGQLTTTDSTGVYRFSDLLPGPATLRFRELAPDNSGAVWELRPGQRSLQNLSISGGQPIMADPVAYQPETHSIEQEVLIDGKPAEGILVDVRPKGAHYAIQSQRTGKDGKVFFLLQSAGNYDVTVYPDPAAAGGPQVNHVQVNSPAKPPAINLPNPVGGGGGPAQNGGRADIDLQAYPVLTEEVPAGVLPASTRQGTAGSIGGTSALGQAADKAIREVLSWRTKSDDSKGFLAALGQAFDLKEVEGHTEWTWTPRSYTVQTDMGAVTGAQASIYTRAKVALDQSMPLLDGLYPLVPNVEAEDLATVQSVVRTQFTALVNEFGTVGGPRVSRVDELFQLLLGHEDPDLPPTRPEEIVKGSLGKVRQRFGFQRRYVTTVDDEQNFTNYLILVDYVIGLNHSWIHDKDYFIRNGIQPGFSPFFGTQLVLLSRALDVVVQAVRDAYFAMDSVFMGDAERQVAQLDFAGLIVKVPNPRTGSPELHTFKPRTSGLFVAELLDWVDRAASDELPRLLQDAGKDGLESLQLVTDRLRKFVHGAIVPPQKAPSLPPGYHTPRVKRAMQLLADGLDETYKLAVQLSPPDLPVEVSPDDLRRLIREEIGRASARG